MQKRFLIFDMSTIIKLINKGASVKIITGLMFCILMGGVHLRASGQKVYQVPNSQRYFIGIKAGVLASLTTYGDSDLEREFSPSLSGGFHAAGLINFPLKKNFSFQSEFGFARMGRKVSFNSGSWSNTSTHNFLDFGMLLRRSFLLKVWKNIPSNWYFNLGPNIKYWLSGKGNVVSPGLPQPYSIVFNGQSKGEYDKMYYYDANRWLFGMDVGVGMNAGTIKGQQVMVELRFLYGHTYLGGKDSVTPQSINLLGFNDSLLANFKTLSISVAYTIDFHTGENKMGKTNKPNYH